MENSIDAGAREVRVDMDRGGAALIRVSDDGCGMSREDALLSLERHATSKLRVAGDLAAIRTLGFRGEAAHVEHQLRLHALAAPWVGDC